MSESDAPSGRMRRLRSRLARSNSAIGRGLFATLSRDRIDEEQWDEVEATLLAADLGVGATEEFLQALRTAVRVEGAQADLPAIAHRELVTIVDPNLDRSLNAPVTGRPAVILVVGVNGTGKTTSTGKLAALLATQGLRVVLAAADTFRAAAAEQLQTWADRAGVSIVRGNPGQDPASVAFDAVEQAQATNADVVIVDTAGRLHTKTGLMDELDKVRRVIGKRSEVDEVLLVIDATTGQNGLVQARVFGEVIGVTGIVLTKLDGTAKGGIIVPIQRELGVPVKLVGLGEGIDDLAPFDAESFVDAVLSP